MQKAIPDDRPPPSDEVVHMKRGAKRIVLLFLLTIATAVSFHNFFHLPPVLGMMTGLAYLKFFGYYLAMTNEHVHGEGRLTVEDSMPFDIFNKVARAEWDTLLFFYGVILCVGGLGFIGYLELVSQFAYVDVGPTFANIMVGLLSAIVDNIPVMFAVLTMNPDMSQGQWLLVTLTAGVGGSMLSIGSAAGVALMGQAKGVYTFFEHLRWTKYIAARLCRQHRCTHFIVNSLSFLDLLEHSITSSTGRRARALPRDLVGPIRSQPDATTAGLVDGGEPGLVGGEFIGGRSDHAEPTGRYAQTAHRLPAQARLHVLLPAEMQAHLAAGHGQVDVGEDLRIQQRAVQVAVGVVDAVALAQGIQAVALAWMHPRAITRLSATVQSSSMGAASSRQRLSSWFRKPTSKGALWITSSAPLQ
jgi:hypothetical protein